MSGNLANWGAIAFPRQSANIIMEQSVAARLGGLHQRKGAIPCDIDRFHSVHLNGNAQTHMFFTFDAATMAAKR